MSTTSAVFVFGSNLAGIHGAGAARTAMQQHGARWGQGIGRTGNAYAIPTKDESIRSMTLPEIAPFVEKFIQYAKEHSEEQFFVTRIGCGLAGFRDLDIGPMFNGVPANCIMPKEWERYIDDTPGLQYHTWDKDQQNHKM